MSSDRVGRDNYDSILGWNESPPGPPTNDPAGRPYLPGHRGAWLQLSVRYHVEGRNPDPHREIQIGTEHERVRIREWEGAELRAFSHHLGPVVMAGWGGRHVLHPDGQCRRFPVHCLPHMIQVSVCRGTDHPYGTPGTPEHLDVMGSGVRWHERHGRPWVDRLREHWSPSGSEIQPRAGGWRSELLPNRRW